jgi:hypothetical protein
MQTSMGKKAKKLIIFLKTRSLIVERREGPPLTESVVNIGRRLENQLVIDDPRAR